jgi:hypothetical protein
MRARTRRAPGIAALGAVLLFALPAAGVAGSDLLGAQTEGRAGARASDFDDHGWACPSPRWKDDLTREQLEELVEQGRQLFSSTTALAQQPSQGTLVGDQLLSCASCHAGAGFTDGRVHEVGPTATRERVLRNTPHLLAIGGHERFGWDGRFGCLQAAIANAVTSPIEMNAAQPPTREQLDALALFVERLDAPPAVPGVDYDPEQAERGALLFASYRGIDLSGEFTPFDGVACIHCHPGPLGTDDKFHRIVLPPAFGSVGLLDPGHVDEDGRIRGFRTPVLRGVRLTAPYFHDGTMGDPTGAVGPRVDDPPIAALYAMMAAYRARFLFDFTPEEELAIIHYLLSL